MNGDEFDDEEMELSNKLDPLCGCTNTPSYMILRDCMRVMQDKSDFNAPGWFEALSKRRTEAAGGGSWEIVMLLIDVLGWSEHGGGINSSWLTPKGEEALAALERMLEIDAIRDARDEGAPTPEQRSVEQKPQEP